MILRICRDSLKRLPSGVLEELSTLPLSIASCLHPPTAAWGATSKPLQGEEDSVTDTVMCCFTGLKFDFSSSQTTFRMLLFKCCSRICHYICSNCTCLLWRQMQWASIGISALPGRDRGGAGGFLCSHLLWREWGGLHLTGWGSPFTLLQALGCRPPAASCSIIFYIFLMPLGFFIS